MSNRIVLESAPEVLDGLREKINTERYWLAGTVVGVIVGALLPWEQVKVFTVFAGGAFFILVFVEMWYSIQHEDRWHKAKESAYRRQNGLPLPAHEAENLPQVAPAEPVIVYTEQKTSATSATVMIGHYDKPPSKEFLKFIFDGMDKATRQIATESVAGAYGVKFELWSTVDSNAWFSILDKEHITEKAWDSKGKNAPRRIVEGMTLDEACKRFGLPPAPPSPE